MRLFTGCLSLALALVLVPEARAQSHIVVNASGLSAGQALQGLLIFTPPLSSQSVVTTQASLTAAAAGGLEYTQALFSILQRQVSTFPIGSAAGGFSYVFNPQLGLPVRRTSSFGPMFADRPMTGGRRKIAASLAFQSTTWQGVGGVDFRRGFTETRTYASSETEGGAGNPVLASNTASMKFATARGVLSLNYGLSDRIDVGLLLTSGSAVMSWSGVYTETDLTTGQTLAIDERKESGASSGIGDTTVRAKFEFLSRPAVDLAAGLDVRVPTGNADDLLGTGATQTRVQLIGAFPRGPVSPHFNVGYSYVPGSTPGISVPYALSEDSPTFIVKAPDVENPDEINYTAGADIAVNRMLTIAGDVIGRTLLHSYDFERTVTPTISQISMRRGAANVLVGAVGVKLLLHGSWLLNLSGALPLNDAGLKPAASGVMGLEYAF